MNDVLYVVLGFTQNLIDALDVCGYLGSQSEFADRSRVEPLRYTHGEMNYVAIHPLIIIQNVFGSMISEVGGFVTATSI